jgi:hypothetical protein
MKQVIIVPINPPIDRDVFNEFVGHVMALVPLWGHPIQLGPTKVHVYGGDRKHWEPVDFEITEKAFVAMLEPHRAEDMQRRVEEAIAGWERQP